jgi:hypothetical protein
MRKLVLVSTAFMALSVLLVLGMGSASAQTATPTVTLTPYGTPYYTPTPTPTATPQPAYIVNDPNFMQSNTYWQPSGSTVEWSPGRWQIPSGGSISQTISYITSTQTYTITVRAGAPTTSTLQLYVGGALIETFTITKPQLSTYQVKQSVSVPTEIKVKASSGTVNVGHVALVPPAGYGPMGYGYEQGLGNASPVDIGGMVEWFTPIQLVPKFTGEFALDWNTTMRRVAQIAATFLQIATPQVINYYIAARIAIMATLWFFGWVMAKIGKPIPPSNSSVVILGRDTGYRAPNFGALPKLPPSGLGRGGRRRSRW